MANKYSEALQDAYMLGDLDKVAELKLLIENEHAEKIAAQRPTKKETIVKYNTVLNDDNSSAVKIYTFLNKAYGNDWWEDEYETLDRLLWLDYGITLSTVNRDKVSAIRHACRSDAAFYDWFVFNQLAVALSGSIADFQYLRFPSPGAIINAVQTLSVIRPEKNNEYEESVKDFMCITLMNDGISVPPPSIASIIALNMKDLSKLPTRQWKKVAEKFNNKPKEDDESQTGIQARRLIVAEVAASKY